MHVYFVIFWSTIKFFRILVNILKLFIYNFESGTKQEVNVFEKSLNSFNIFNKYTYKTPNII